MPGIIYQATSCNGFPVQVEHSFKTFLFYRSFNVRLLYFLILNRVFPRYFPFRVPEGTVRVLRIAL